MSEETFTIGCPGCEATFDLPISLGGELGECTECSVIFEIPKLDGGAEEENLIDTDSGTVKTVAADDQGATNTVKLSRNSIGMVPDVKDSFNFDVVEKPSENKKKTFSTRRGMSKAKRPSARPKPQKKWWQFWK